VSARAGLPAATVPAPCKPIAAAAAAAAPLHTKSRRVKCWSAMLELPVLSGEGNWGGLRSHGNWPRRRVSSQKALPSGLAEPATLGSRRGPGDVLPST